MKKKRKKQLKTYELDEKWGYVIVGLLIIFITIMVWVLINVVKANRITYTYYKEDKKGISKECYTTDDQEHMCLIGDNYIWVDSYHD